MAKTIKETQQTVGPKSMEIDNEEIEQFGADDLLKLRDAENSEEIQKSPNLGVMFRRMVPPSTG